MAILDDTRADWNARAPLRARTTVPWPDRIGVSWHWIGPGKGPSVNAAHQKCLDRVRDWQAMHQANGWKDIGYNALVCQHARAIEGRGLTFSGSHSPGVNVVHVGIQFMCGEGDTFPSAAMIARGVRLRSDIGALGKNIHRDWAHRDDPKASTECCGDELAAWVHRGGPTKNATTTPTTAPAAKDWFDMATQADLEKALTNVLLNNADVKREIARFTWTGYAFGPEGSEKVGAGWVALLDQLARLNITAASDDLTPEQIKQALTEAVASSVKVTGSLELTPKEMQ